jgi:hypothetical protein
MNSLYGKFGQRTEHSCYFMNMKDAAGALPVSMDGSVTCSHENKRNAFVNPMLSSLTTDYARNRLRDYAGRVEQDDLLYCDTDSIYTFSGRIENSKQLGMMKLEKSVAPFYLVKPKFYIAGDVKKGKGVPKEDMSFRNFLAFLKGGEIVSRRGIVKFKSGVRNTDLGGSMVKAKVLKKSMRTPYDKRIIKGLETKPFSVRMQPHLYPEVNRREFSKYVRELMPKVALLVGSDEKKKD